MDSGEDAHPKALDGLQAGLSIKEGIEPMEQQGAQGEADKHGGEDVADHDWASLMLRLSCCKY